MLSTFPQMTAVCGSWHPPALTPPGAPPAAVALAVLPQLMGDLRRTVQPTQPHTCPCRVSLARDKDPHPAAVAQSVPTAARASRYFCSLPLNQMIFLKPNSSVWQKLFCPSCPPFSFSIYIFPVLSAKVLCVFPCLCAVFSVPVHTVILFGFFPSLQPPRLLSFLSAVFWFPFLNCSPWSV